MGRRWEAMHIDAKLRYNHLRDLGTHTRNGVQYLVAKYAYQARLDEITPHQLRHTFGKNLVDAGVSLE